ncbi:1282_t:CDS:2, partial [Funneliformis geosporum]
MTKKTDLQKELLAEVKEGVKPSDLKRKLKRSKSADDIANIPTPPPLPDHLLHDQLKEKQTEIESLRTKLATANQHEQIKSLNQELDATIDQASSELKQGDTEIKSLERELKLARINRTNSPFTSNNYETKLDYFQYGLYAL